MLKRDVVQTAYVGWIPGVRLTIGDITLDLSSHGDVGGFWIEDLIEDGLKRIDGGFGE